MNHKVNRNELRDYIKTDGSNQMTGDLNLNNKKIINVAEPYLSTDCANKAYITKVVNHLPTMFIDRLGNSSMLGNLNMNNKRINNLQNPILSQDATTLKFVSDMFLDRYGTSKMLGNIDMNKQKIINVIDPVDDLDVSNKLYTDNQIIKSNIKPNSIPKNVFKYLMDDVNEWSSEYNIKVLSFSDMTESPHYWNKRILNITPLKDDDNNYRFRLGIQCFSLENNKEYTLAIELYNKDYETWNKQSTFVNADTAWIESYHTQKFQHHYQENGDIYYTKTLIKFKKTSTSTPNFIYITYHFDDNGGDMSTYPKEFANQVYILAYGSKGLFNHLDSAVYDKHQAFEIDKTKMKMLVPLDLNNKKIINISNDSDVTKINLYGMVDKRRFFTAFTMPIEFNKVRIVNIKLLNTVKTRFKKDVINFYITSSSIIKYPFTFPGHPAYIYIQINKFFNVIHYIKLVNTIDIPFQITYDVFY